MKLLPFLCAALTCQGLLAATPLCRVGVLTDTHITDRPESLAVVKQAFRCFHNEKVDMVVHTGDMAERHIPKAYELYREAFDAEYADCAKPRELYVLAAHDTVRQPGYDAAFAEWKKSLKVPNEMYESFELQGFPVILVPQNVAMTKLTEMLDQAARDYPGKAIIVFDHVPPCHTTDNTDIWGGEDRREVYNKYPQVVHVSGHTHGSLRDELNIWQGEFTAVSAGCLTDWAGLGPGGGRAPVQAYEVLIMDVYPEQLIFRRFDVRDGSEIAPDAPWTIPLPFDAKTAPYRRDALFEKSVAPEFAPDAELTAKPDAVPCTYWTVNIPETPDFAAHTYEVELFSENEAGDWTFLAHRELLANFHQKASERAKTVECTFNSAYLEGTPNVRVEVTPRGFYGKRGKKLAAEFETPELVSTKLLFECLDVMHELPLTTEGGGTRFTAKNGVYELDDHAVLNLPDVESALPKDAKIRITLDFQITAPKDYWWTMSLHRGVKPFTDIQWRTTVGTNDFRLQRLSLEFVNTQQTKIDLLFYNGIRGKAIFYMVKIDQL